MTTRQAQIDEALQNEVSKYLFDPVGYVMWNYPWGEDGTRLKNFEGPDLWQREFMNILGEELKLRATGEVDGPVQIGIASGHGIGKTAQISWLTDWFMDTRPNPQIVCTANTSQQLESKTWREVGVWHNLGLTSQWKVHTATTYYNKMFPQTWRANAIPWSKERSEAFAGTHEAHVMVLFDEASLIDKSIWEVTEGAMTSGECVWVAFGNPTRSSGKFFDIFHRDKHRWITTQVDSRTAMIPRIMGGAKKFEEWVEDYGEDSDFVKVRVRGLFPSAGSVQFISTASVEAASRRVIQPDLISHAPRLIGVDVARFGDDQTVITRRQGLQAYPQKKYRGKDTMQVASLVAQEIQSYNADACFIDETGVGAGVVDRLRQLGFDTVIAVNNNNTPTDQRRYHRKVDECYGKLKKWLSVGSIAPDNELQDDLTMREYGFDRYERIKLESKDDMKARGLASPDCADSLALTFAEPVQTIEDRLEETRLADLERARVENSRRKIGSGRINHRWRFQGK